MMEMVKATSKRGGRCKCCDKLVFEGWKVSIPSQKNGVWVHDDCLKSHRSFACLEANSDNGESKRCIKHLLEIRVPLSQEVLYFNIHGMHTDKHWTTPTHRQMAKVYKKKHQATKNVLHALECGYKVLVNGQQIHSFEEYDKLTTR